jgi:hypothetical protein
MDFKLEAMSESDWHRYLHSDRPNLLGQDLQLKDQSWVRQAEAAPESARPGSRWG